MLRTKTDIDVLIIGGGPGGTTLGTLLAEQGHDVLLLEKDTHPRFHIGESMLPMSLPIFERLGVAEAVAEMGVVKPGADFTPEAAGSDHYTIHFARALGDSPGHAFEVTRATLDALLFDNCRQSGVDAREAHRVVDVQLAATGRHRVTGVDSNGNETEWRPRFIADASGRDAFLASKSKWKRKNPRHASAAVFGHFRGVPRRDGADAGNISVYWFDQGWIWMIPLKDDIMSVGAVCWPEYLKSRNTDPERFLRQTLARSPAAGRRFAGAEAAGPVRVTGNYSYQSRRLTGDGYLLIGDAFAFVDPVFSSGVYLAMNSAERAVPLIEAWLADDNRRYRRLCRQYESTIRRGLKRFSWFIYRFTTPTMRKLFANPRNDFQVEQAIISVLAGDVFATGKVVRRVTIFKFIYFVTWLGQLRDSAKAWRLRRRNVAVTFSE